MGFMKILIDEEVVRSSAKKRENYLFLTDAVGISLMYIENRIGLSTPPCGTPACARLFRLRISPTLTLAMFDYW